MKKKTLSKIIFILIIMFLMIFISVVAVLIYVSQKDITSLSELTNNTEPITFLDVLDSNNVKFKSRKENILYVEFSKPLYEENGNSNRKYYDKIIVELNELFEGADYQLIDNSKNIKIKLEYDAEERKYTININEREEFFDKTEGDVYINTNKTQISKLTNFYFNDKHLENLYAYNFDFSKIEKFLDEGQLAEDGFIEYYNGNIRIRKNKNNIVKCIMFSKDYKDEIFSNIYLSTPLNQVYEKLGEPAFGSLGEKFLAYRQLGYYVFFYENEIVCYPYLYAADYNFEKLLEKYINTNSLENFVLRVENEMKDYDEYNYFPETQSLYMLYANRGIEIDIQMNNPGGITVYKNAFLTSKMKNWLIDNKFNYEYESDLIYEIEKERLENN